ncbi:MAG: tetratricopeptide repeat protein, partial [Thermodesulfobacteriota bacterium]
AVEQYKQLLKETPGGQQLLKELGLTLLYKEDYPEAARVLQRYFKLNPGDREGRFGLAQALRGAERHREAIPHLRALKQEKPRDVEVIKVLADVYRASRQFDNAILEYKQVLKLPPEDLDVRLTLARVLTLAKRFPEAAAEYSKLLGKKYEKDIRTEYAQVLTLAGQGEKAGKEYGKLLADFPKDAQLALARARALEGLKRYQEAIESYRLVKKLEPGNLTARLELAGVLNTAGDFDAAAQEYREILSSVPSMREARYGLAINLSSAGRMEEAVSELNQLLEQDPNDLETLTQRGLVRLWSGKHKLAESDLKRVLAAKTSDPEVHLGLSQLYFQTGRVRPAFREVNTALELNPEYQEAQRYRQTIKDSLRPSAVVSPARIREDNVGNRSFINEIGFSFFPEPGSRADIDLSWIDARSDRINTDSFRLRTAIETRLTDTFGLSGNVSLVSLQREKEEDQHILPGIFFNFFPRLGLTVSAGFQRDVLEHTAELINNDIRTSSFLGRIDYQFLPGYFFFTGYEFTDISDGNIKQRVTSSIGKQILKGNPRLSMGYSFEFLAFARNLDEGYFDPSNYLAHTVNMYLAGDILDNRIFFSIYAFFGDARTGGQPGVVAEFDNIWGGTAIVQLKLWKDLLFEGRLDQFKSATTAGGAPGFRETIFGFGFRYTF